MNAQTQTLPARTPLQAGANVAAMVPRSMEDAFRLANALSSSGLAPRGMDKPEQVLVAIMAGAEIGLPPYQAVQSFAIINNRATLWGDALMGVVKAHGVKVREWLDGEGDAMVARCEATRPGGETTPGEFSVDDAKRAGLWGKAGPWQQYPKRMLKMRARAFALRDGCADMLRGIQMREEVEDYGATHPAVHRVEPAETLRIEAQASPSTIEIVDLKPTDALKEADASAGETQDAQTQVERAAEDHVSALLQDLGKQQTVIRTKNWLDRHKAHLDDLGDDGERVRSVARDQIAEMEARR